MTRLFAKSLATLALALSFVGCENLPTEPARTSRPLRAITFASWSADGYAAPEADAALLNLQATGANTVVLLVTAYQSDPRTSDINPADPRTPTPSSVLAATTRARQLGLGVGLKLHVDVEDGTWRALIDPATPEEWFREYQEFAVPWAMLAETASMEIFVLGTELAGTLQYENLWTETIGKVRGAYAGSVSYSASWDEAGLVPFWSLVDYVGVNAYYPVATRGDPSRFDLLAGWQPWLEKLRQLQRRTNRPIVLTELGYRSVDGAGMDPYDFTSSRPIDLEEQADLYWAAVEATGGEPWLHGICWWNWPADGTGGSADAGYSANGKPAAEVLAAAW